MTILLVGGGSGGHITPLLAVAHELKARHKNIRVVAVIDRATSFGHLLESSPDIDQIERITAGKLRRYPGRSLSANLLDVHTTILNIRDVFRTVSGTFEARSVLKKVKPDAIFIKGGFVGVPVGVAARLQKISFITHDSDAEPGLANRLIGRWARVHCVGMPTELYGYPADKMVQVGIPLSANFKPVTEKQQQNYRHELGLSASAHVIFVTGGSQGAQRLNEIVGKALPSLLKDKNLVLIHQTGPKTDNLPEDSPQYIKLEFITDLYRYSGAADLVITRAGGTVAEFAVQVKPVIAIPAPQLASGHQLKNGEYLDKHEAAVVLQESELLANPKKLTESVDHLLSSPAERHRISRNLSKLYPADAAAKIAGVITDIAAQAEKA